MNLTIRPENGDNQDSIQDVHEQAFGGPTEANLVMALRAGGYVKVSLVATLNDKIVVHILFCPVTINCAVGSIEILSLAPLGVLPEFQRQGIGATLVKKGIEACQTTSYSSIVVLGHPNYYTRFGFSPKLARSLNSPFGDGDSWMAMELFPGALSGISGAVVYPPPFNVLE
ncbi:MAG: N-acetyltransferase [Schlesneria sp.]